MESVSLSPAQLKFLTRLTRKLERRGAVLRDGHVGLALSVQDSSSLTHALTAPVFGFSVLTAVVALIVALTNALSLDWLLVVTPVTAVGAVCYGMVWLVGPQLQLADAATQIVQAELEDQRVVAGLRGRALRNAKRSLASFSEPWGPEPRG